MKPEIMLYSGEYFNFLEPEKSKITIEDIATALSKINRYTGHTSKPFSVAEHCVRGSIEIETEHNHNRFLANILGLEFLLHDAAEAVLNDISTPLKQLLPEYKVIEQRVELDFARRFGTSFPMLPEVKVCDSRMLATEVIFLMPVKCQQWECLQGVKPYDIQINPWTPKVAEKAFLKRYYSLMEQRSLQ